MMTHINKCQCLIEEKTDLPFTNVEDERHTDQVIPLCVGEIFRGKCGGGSSSSDLRSRGRAGGRRFSDGERLVKLSKLLAPP